jgi:EAL domain-containing protein (putative c-di-GMP-specific phosphodiesterase class I)
VSAALGRLLAPGGLTPLFQPVFQVTAGTAQLASVEALVRGPAGSNFERADVLFDYVRRKHAEFEVDRACLATILSAATLLPGYLRFSANVHAVTLSRDPGFLDTLLRRLEAHHLSPSRLTLEIVEHAPAFADAALFRTLDALRATGIRIALDDVGLGMSNYRMVLDLRPDFLKIDRYFVSGAPRDEGRRFVIESIELLGRRFGARVIAEGAETRDEVDACLGLGVHLIQGHYFSGAVPAALVDLVAQAEPADAGPRAWRPLSVANGGAA